MSDASGDGSVRITQREVYNLVVEVRDGVNELRTRDADSTRIHEDHEARLRALEVWRWKAAGALAFAVLLIGAFGYWAANTFVHVPH